MWAQAERKKDWKIKENSVKKIEPNLGVWLDRRMSECKLVELFLDLTLEVKISPVERRGWYSALWRPSFFFSHSWHLEEEIISHRAIGSCPLTHASHNSVRSLLSPRGVETRGFTEAIGAIWKHPPSNAGVVLLIYGCTLSITVNKHVEAAASRLAPCEVCTRPGAPDLDVSGAPPLISPVSTRE